MRILVTGATGLIGKNFELYLKRKCPDWSIIGLTRLDADLRYRGALNEVLESFNPNIVVHLAALVGGINANNSQKYRFLHENTQINLHTIDACIAAGVNYILAAGTGCAYPKSLEGELLTEDKFLDGEPEPTNDAYAYSKRLLYNQLQAAHESFGTKFSYILPANIYGPYDNFHPLHSHVVPGLIQRMYEAKTNGDQVFKIWGTGRAKRDFLYIDDLMEAMFNIIKYEYHGIINIASGHQTSILDLAKHINETIDANLEFEFDRGKPDGQSTRVVDVKKITTLGWKPETSLQAGIEQTVQWFYKNQGALRKV